jgi:hypothetical protein
MLSWRVHLLPYIEQQALYSRFRLNEPWDSPHNLSLLKYMPDLYRPPGDSADSETTGVKTFTGPGAPYTGTAPTQSLRSSQLTDGRFNTILFAEAGRGVETPWTKPDDTPFHQNNPFSALGELGATLLAGFGDAHMGTLLSSMSISQLSAYITPRGGEDVNNPLPVPNVPGFYIHQTGGNTKTNEFGADAFDIVLDKAPASNVVLQLAVDNPTAATLDKTTLTFTPNDWNQPQRVVFRPIDDHATNPDRMVSISASIVDSLSDNAYDSVETQVISALIRDDDAVPSLPSDFNDDGAVDGADFLRWQRGLGTSSAAAKSHGDSNADGDVDRDDLISWRTQFGLAAGQTFAADFSGDQRVSGVDLAAWKVKFGMMGASRGDGDADSDADVDGSDFLAWQRMLGSGMAAAVSAAEQAMFDLAMLAGLPSPFTSETSGVSAYLIEETPTPAAVESPLVRDAAFGQITESDSLIAEATEIVGADSQPANWLDADLWAQFGVRENRNTLD